MRLRVRPTFDMRAAKGASPGRPLDGRVRHHCVFARMPACLNHVHGWTIWGGYGTLPLKPRFLVASDRSQVARRRVRLDLGDPGSLNSNSTRARTSLVPKPLPSCDAFASNWSIPRTLDRFLLPTVRPRFQEQRTTGHTQSALHSALQCME